MTMGYPLIVVENGIRMFTNGDSPICDRCEGPVEGEDGPMWCKACDGERWPCNHVDLLRDDCDFCYGRGKA